MKNSVANVVLRAAEVDDAITVFEWRNHPTVRKYLFNGDPLVFSEHLAWFKNKVNNVDCQLLIAELNAQPVGVVRLDLNHCTAEISIYLDPKKMGQGLGSMILKKSEAWVIEKLPMITELIAKVLVDNTASIKAFTKADFTCQYLVYHKKCNRNHT